MVIFGNLKILFASKSSQAKCQTCEFDLKLVKLYSVLIPKMENTV